MRERRELRDRERGAEGPHSTVPGVLSLLCSFQRLLASLRLQPVLPPSQPVLRPRGSGSARVAAPALVCLFGGQGGAGALLPPGLSHLTAFLAGHLSQILAAVCYHAPATAEFCIKTEPLSHRPTAKLPVVPMASTYPLGQNSK